LLLACSAPGPGADPIHLTLAGSSTVQPVAEIAAERFVAAHPGWTIDVQGGGSGVGISSARSGLADIGMVSRDLKPEEAELEGKAIALDGIALIAHTQNPVRELSKDQVISLFTGAAPTWAAVGGPDQPVTVVTKEEGRSTRELFDAFFGVKDTLVKTAIVIGPNGQAITTVSGNPWAVAYVSIGAATVAIAGGAPIRMLGMDGKVASVETVRSGSWPLQRPLYLVTMGEAVGPAWTFIEYLRSEEGQAIAKQEGFVPVLHAP
jgi:phosphate transport system substrate-binding protein